jgi:hypothetical protein
MPFTPALFRKQPSAGGLDWAASLLENEDKLEIALTSNEP